MPRTNLAHQTINWSAISGRVTVKGPGGTFQIKMPEAHALLLARVLGLALRST